MEEIDRLFSELQRTSPALAYDTLIEYGALLGDSRITHLVLEQSQAHVQRASMNRVHAHMRALAAERKGAQLDSFVKNLDHYGVIPTRRTFLLLRNLQDQMSSRV